MRSAYDSQATGLCRYCHKTGCVKVLPSHDCWWWLCEYHAPWKATVEKEGEREPDRATPADGR